jgi:hypothetical protein
MEILPKVYRQKNSKGWKQNTLIRIGKKERATAKSHHNLERNESNQTKEVSEYQYKTIHCLKNEERK